MSIIILQLVIIVIFHFHLQIDVIWLEGFAILLWKCKRLTWPFASYSFVCLHGSVNKDAAKHRVYLLTENIAVTMLTYLYNWHLYYVEFSNRWKQYVFHLFRFSFMFLSVFCSFQHISSIRFIPKYFSFFWVIINGIVFLISASSCLLLVYRNTSDFFCWLCILQPR